MDSEQEALGRVLWIAKEAYSAIAKGEIKLNGMALLDSISAALSHFDDMEQPISKLLGKLKREIKSKNKEFYPNVKQYFSELFPVLDYDVEKAERHIPAIISGNDKICARFVMGERDKALSMCEAMKCYPGFLFGEYEALSDKQFYDLVFGYYPKLYEKDDFMGDMKHLFW